MLGPFSLAKQLEPFSQHGQELITLVNYYLNQETCIIGWVIVAAQEIDGEAAAASYFKSLLGVLCRVIPANCVPDADLNAMAKEIQTLVGQMYGLVVLQKEEGSEIETELTCFKADCPLTLVQELLSGQRIVDPDDSLLLLPADTLSELDPVQLDVMSQVQEESQLKDVLAAANIAFGAVASSRKARKHRSTATNDAQDDGLKDIAVEQAPVDFLPIPDPASLLTEFNKVDAVYSPAGYDANQSEVLIDVDHANTSLKVEHVSEKMQEYEALLSWIKVLSQPDDAILKKVAVFEEYEERMRKLGAKLKQSLSPEDLIKTLASIQPSTPKAK